MVYSHQTLTIIRSATSWVSAGDNVLSNLAARWRVTSSWVMETRSAVCELAAECNRLQCLSSALCSCMTILHFSCCGLVCARHAFVRERERERRDIGDRLVLAIGFRRMMMTMMKVLQAGMS